MRNQEVVTKVTARIIEPLEQGVKPWECSWERSGPPMPRNLKTGRYYQGINVPIPRGVPPRVAVTPPIGG